MIVCVCMMCIYTHTMPIYLHIYIYMQKKAGIRSRCAWGHSEAEGR